MIDSINPKWTLIDEDCNYLLAYKNNNSSDFSRVDICECLNSYTRGKANMHTTLSKDGYCLLCEHATLSVRKFGGEIPFRTISNKVLQKELEKFTEERVKKTEYPALAYFKANKFKTKGITLEARQKMVIDVLIECKFDRQKCMEAFDKDNFEKILRYLHKLKINYFEEMTTHMEKIC